MFNGLRRYRGVFAAEPSVSDCLPDPSARSLVPAVALATIFLMLETGVLATPRYAPLYDSVRLNIGLNCRWEQRCIARQQRAMERALKFVKVHQPPQARIQQCNRNASRGRGRVDWIGFDNCIRNASLRTFRRR